MGFDGAYWVLPLPNHAMLFESEGLWPLVKDVRGVLDRELRAGSAGIGLEIDVIRERWVAIMGEV
jgi:hypothetical protein